MPPGQGKELIRNFVNLSMGWWVDGLIGSLGGLWGPPRGAKGSKREPKGAQLDAKGAKRDPTGGQDGDKQDTQHRPWESMGAKGEKKGPKDALWRAQKRFCKAPGGATREGKT